MTKDQVVSQSGRSATVGLGPAEPILTRRAVLAGVTTVGGALLSRRPSVAAPAALPGSPTILVAGPRGSRADQWAAIIAEPLGKGLLLAEAMGRENVGGPDGVTGANYFQASTPPDGATAMIMPGTAALSWLVGDARVRFDAGNWIPLWGGTVSVLALCRGPLVRGRRVRVAVQTLVGPELPVLLALDLMGIDAVAVPAAPGAAGPIERPDIDVVVLRGAELKQGRSELAANRWLPAFALGTIGADGRLGRDPTIPDVPTSMELIEREAGVPPGRGGLERFKQLSIALRSITAAAGLDVALVLPLPTPAAVVAWWRQACAALANSPDVQEEAGRQLARSVETGAVAASIAAITAESSALLELRHWLGERHHWQPG